MQPERQGYYHVCRSHQSKAMKYTIDETARRRKYSKRYNERRTRYYAATIIKPIRDVIEATKAYTGAHRAQNPKEMTTRCYSVRLRIREEMKQAAMIFSSKEQQSSGPTV